MTSFVVPGRYNGPPESGNGGWVCGHLSTFVPAAAVEVRLQQPPPLDTAMTVEAEPIGVSLAWDHGIVATARPGIAPGDDPVPSVGLDRAVAAGAAYEGLDSHPFATCYVCGPARSDGLGMRPGPVDDGSGAYAAVWTPTVPGAEDVWAALDCPGGWASGIRNRPMVLGTMTAIVFDQPAIGEPHVVMAWLRSAEGRKSMSATALYATSGRLLARAEATWIAIDPASVRPVAGVGLPSEPPSGGSW